ncbi:MAG: hypothetical protein IPM18_03010 [Phycisphaerales bacterium]|nr:hypothetical protein [Phycisphaerales bacterium]
MTQRERILALCLVGVLGFLGVAVVVDRALIKPMRNLQSNIQVAEERRDELDRELARLAAQERRWRELTRRTFSADEREAQQRFREELQALLEKHGMTDVRVTPLMRNARQRGLVEMPVMVTARGPLNSVVGFLCDFYQRGYLARIDRLTLGADPAVISEYNAAATRARTTNTPRGRGRTGSGANAAGPELSINMTAVTVVLERQKGLDHPVLPAELGETNGTRLLRPVDAYDLIVDRNPFRPYEPPPPTPLVRDPEPGPVVVAPPPERHPEPVVVPPPPPPDAIVSGIESWEGQRVAYVLFDPRTGTAQLRPVYEGASLFDGGGTVILIHRDGLVARVEKDGEVRDYFYARGSNFRDREELSAIQHPSVWAALQRRSL